MRHSSQNPQYSRWRRTFFMLTAAALLVPVLAKAAWGLEDYAAATVLLSALWIGFEATSHIVVSRAVQIVAMAGIVVAFLIIWAHLAIGVW